MRLAALLLLLVSAALHAAEGPKVGLVVIHSEINDLQARFYKRILKEAVDGKFDAVVVHLTTDGGTLQAGREMMFDALNMPSGGPKLVAYIDNRAYSAGALIAYAHDNIYMSRVATIGDIGVIFQGAEGRIEYAPEKVQSVVRTLLRSAQIKGWNKAKLVKMTALDQELYRFDLPGGSEFVIEDDLQTWLADHPTVDPDKKILVLGKDRLISYTASEAAAEGMATAVVTDINEVYAKLGVEPANVIAMKPTGVEEISWKLATFAPILMSLAILFAIIEFKAPGFGLWATLSAICGATFFVCQYYQELASHIEIIMVLAGVAMLVVDLFLFPTGGILAILGVVACMSGIILAFMPDNLQFHPNTDGYSEALSSALAQSTIALAMLTVGLILLIRHLPSMKAVNRIAVTAEIRGTSAGAMESNTTLIGKRAQARSDLRPSGFITLDGNELSATTENGEYIAAGRSVEIIAMRYGEAIVRAIA